MYVIYIYELHTCEGTWIYYMYVMCMSDCGLRQGAVYGLGVAAASGGTHFAPFVQQTAQVILNCITHADAYEGMNGAASDNAVSALGKLCDVHCERFPSAQQLIETQWLPRLPLTSDEEESVTVTNHLCAMIQNPQRSSLVLGTNFEQLGRVLNVLMTVITSDRSEGLWNKKLKVRIQQLWGQLKQVYHPKHFKTVSINCPRISSNSICNLRTTRNTFLYSFTFRNVYQ